MLVSGLIEPAKEERDYSLCDGFFHDGVPRMKRNSRELSVFRRALCQESHKKRMYRW